MAALATFLAGAGWAQSSSSASVPHAATFNRRTPVFVENRGQWDGDFLYKTRVGAMTVFIEKTGWTFTLEERREKPKASDSSKAMEHPGMPEWEFVRGVAVKMRFAGSSGAMKVVPGARSSGVHNYFLGNDLARWRTDIPLCDGIRLVGVWPGVDVGLRFEAGHLEYDVFVAPGADLSHVVFEVEGADGLRLDADGTPVIETSLGPVRQTQPRTWQIADDETNEPVACSFVLLSENRFGFSAPARAPERPLVIDPGLLYSSFLGGEIGDVANSVALDATGAATVAGYTYSTNFPTTAGAYDTSHNGGLEDAFVARLNAAGSGLVYGTYLGGGGTDIATSVALDAMGAAIVAGRSSSTNFPTTAGAYDTSYNGAQDAFVARLNATGSGLVYGTYLGGGGTDIATSVALDATGAATVAGDTYSTDFPATAGAFDTTLNGILNAFVARLNAAGSALVYATYLGGSQDNAYSVAVDATGDATVAGRSLSTNFPTTTGAFDTSLNGPSDGFVARLNAAGSGIVYSTYLGGGGADAATSVALDATGAATVVGVGSSGFPTTAGAYNSSSNGGAFVVRLNAAGSGLVFGAFLGGGGVIDPSSVALDAAGTATVVGYVGGSFASFPTTVGAFDTSHNGADDAFVARLSATGDALLYGTYLGGVNDERCFSVAVDATGAATIVGLTDSVNFPTTAGAYDTSLTGALDGYVARLQLSTFSHPLMAFPPVQSVPSGGVLGLQVAGPPGAPVALMFDPVAQAIPVSPYGTIGIAIPPLLTADGIGLGFPGSTPMPLTIGSQGILYFSYSPVPASLVGSTLYAQAVAVSIEFAGGVALSTHGNAALPTPACQVTFVP